MAVQIRRPSYCPVLRIQMYNIQQACPPILLQVWIEWANKFSRQDNDRNSIPVFPLGISYQSFTAISDDHSLVEGLSALNVGSRSRPQGPTRLLVSGPRFVWRGGEKAPAVTGARAQAKVDCSRSCWMVPKHATVPFFQDLQRYDRGHS